MIFAILFGLTTEASVPAGTEKPDIVCVREELTGSRIGGRRICRPRAEYERIAREAREDAERSRRAVPKTPNGI